ncbi:MAG: aminopeptidase [Lachnospiraceae bacterium]|jgi:Aspartyl aminopeptidase
MKKDNLWRKYTNEEKKKVQEVCDRYKDCLNHGKTERECVSQAVEIAQKNGYKELFETLEKGEPIKVGDKLYAVQMDKSVVLFQIGKKLLSDGMNILGAHIDSPRIDIKQNPLYEKEGFAYFDTHYYGGIKKYQWTAIPLAIHGVIAKKDGTIISVSIGEKEDEPVFVISDLLVHLSGKQMAEKASEVIKGENLDLLIGNCPIEQDETLDQEEKEALKANILKILAESYDIEEEDLLSAELEIVPAGKARDLGLDRSMILGYGHDDRVCAFTSVFAMMNLAEEVTERTLCCILVDKEEIGNAGATGAESRFFENTVAELIAATEKDSQLLVRRALANSKMLSSDVSAGYDPLYADVFEKNNAAFLARGLAFNKYTGSGGKSGSSDANAKYVARIRKIMDDADIMYQFCELGKVDAGGGGTIARVMAKYGMNVIDSGVAVINMHAPYEVVSKADVYEAVQGYTAFLKRA